MESDQYSSDACTNCQNFSLRPARARSAFWHGDRLVVIEDVPALVCDSCGEQFYDDNTVVMIERLRGDGFPPERAAGEMLVPVFSFGDMPLPGAAS